MWYISVAFLFASIVRDTKVLAAAHIADAQSRLVDRRQELRGSLYVNVDRATTGKSASMLNARLLSQHMIPPPQTRLISNSHGYDILAREQPERIQQLAPLHLRRFPRELVGLLRALPEYYYGDASWDFRPQQSSEGAWGPAYDPNLYYGDASNYANFSRPGWPQNAQYSIDGDWQPPFEQPQRQSDFYYDEPRRDGNVTWRGWPQETRFPSDSDPRLPPEKPQLQLFPPTWSYDNAGEGNDYSWPGRLEDARYPGDLRPPIESPQFQARLPNVYDSDVGNYNSAWSGWAENEQDQSGTDWRQPIDFSQTQRLPPNFYYRTDGYGDNESVLVEPWRRSPQDLRYPNYTDSRLSIGPSQLSVQPFPPQQRYGDDGSGSVNELTEVFPNESSNVRSHESSGGLAEDSTPYAQNLQPEPFDHQNVHPSNSYGDRMWASPSQPFRDGDASAAGEDYYWPTGPQPQRQSSWVEPSREESLFFDEETWPLEQRPQPPPEFYQWYADGAESQNMYDRRGPEDGLDAQQWQPSSPDAWYPADWPQRPPELQWPQRPSQPRRPLQRQQPLRTVWGNAIKAKRAVEGKEGALAGVIAGNLAAGPLGAVVFAYLGNKFQYDNGFVKPLKRREKTRYKKPPWSGKEGALAGLVLGNYLAGPIGAFTFGYLGNEVQYDENLEGREPDPGKPQNLFHRANPVL